MNEIILNGIPYDGELLITVNDNEIPVSPGDFGRMTEAKMFSSISVDENDFIKIIGIDVDGKHYVSERGIDDLTDDEQDAYFKRYDENHEKADIRIIKNPKDFKTINPHKISY